MFTYTSNRNYFLHFWMMWKFSLEFYITGNKTASNIPVWRNVIANSLKFQCNRLISKIPQVKQDYSKSNQGLKSRFNSPGDCFHISGERLNPAAYVGISTSLKGNIER